MVTEMADVDNNTRFRLDEPVRTKWKEMLEARQITQQRAIASMVAWIVEQDPLLQTMLFRQVPQTDQAELSRIVLRRLKGGGEPTYAKLVESTGTPGGKRKGK